MSRRKLLVATDSCKAVIYKPFSTDKTITEKRAYKLVVVGGGAGGISMAAKFTRTLGKGNVAIIEPANVHYYQPLWTLVGGGLKRLEDSQRPMSSVIPNGSHWLQERVVSFSPENHSVKTHLGKEIKYDYLIIAMGLTLHFDEIRGLPGAFQSPGVCSNYSYETANKTMDALRNFQEGNAIFTQPSCPVKCAGAPQKAMYLSDAFLRKVGKRDKAKIMLNSGLGVLFSAPVYAKALARVCERKDISVNLNTNLIEIKPENREAIFEVVNSKETPKERVTFPYDMIHITPPMKAPKELRDSCLVDKTTGFLTVNKGTLQHVTYPNIFGIGDCTSLPTSKTAAAIASQCGILSNNLSEVMGGKTPSKMYDGYSSCPLVTSRSTGILAEFDYNLEPLETFPYDQSKERWISYFMKANLMAPLYWNVLLKGYWNGPKIVRKLLHFGMGK